MGEWVIKTSCPGLISRAICQDSSDSLTNFLLSWDATLGIAYQKKPLPNRINIVVTSRPFEHEGVTCVSDIIDHTDFYWLIGGAKLIEQSWSYINEIHLTKVYDHYTCDTFIDLLYIEHNFNRTYSEVFPDHRYEIWKKK